jgi:hypothetical protein
LSGIARRGGPHGDVNDLLLTDPDTVIDLAARLALLDLDNSGPSIGGSRARAGLAGCYYWDGSGSGLPGDWSGHIFANVMLGADAAGAIRAEYAVTRCGDPGCSQPQILQNGTIGSAALTLFASHVLALSYDGRAFLFRLDAEPPIRVPAPGARRLATPNAFRALRTESTTDGLQTEASVLSLFDRVEVNGVAYDEFRGTAAAPKVRIVPASGAVATTQTVDVVVLVEPGADAIVGGRLVINGEDVTGRAGTVAEVEPLSGGRVAVRFSAVRLGAVLPPGRSTVLAAEVWTASGAVGRDFAVWQPLPVTEP